MQLPEATVRVEEIGEEREPLVIIDNFRDHNYLDTVYELIPELRKVSVRP